MQIVQTTQAAVIDAFLTKIRAGMPTLFNETNSWVSDDPSFEVPAASRHKLYLIVYPTEGTPGESEFAGGGDESTIEYTGATVVVYSVMRLQQSGKPGIVLTAPVVGLFAVKHALLTALHGQWLLNGSSNSLLTQPIQAVHCERPTIQGQPVGDLAITFSLPFHWDLT